MDVPTPEAKKSNRLRNGCLIGLAVIVGFGVLGAMLDKSPNSAPGASPSAAVSPAESPSNDPEISAAEFAQLKPGLSYDKAVAIIGSPGEVLSETTIAGTRTVMYKWDGDSLGANANVMFQGGKLVSKAQFGLK